MDMRVMVVRKRMNTSVKSKRTIEIVMVASKSMNTRVMAVRAKSVLRLTKAAMWACIELQLWENITSSRGAQKVKHLRRK